MGYYRGRIPGDFQGAKAHGFQFGAVRSYRAAYVAVMHGVRMVEKSWPHGRDYNVEFLMTVTLHRYTYLMLAFVGIWFIAPVGRGAVASFGQFDQQARAGRPMSVVFFGGSLTWGANARNPQRNSYRALMERYLENKYPRTQFRFHDAAIGGTGSMLGLFRLRRDVLAYKPNLVFLEFTANDNLYGADVQTLACYERILRTLIQKGVPVEQVFLGFKSNYGPQAKSAKWPRLMAHQRLAAAYHTAVSDSFPLVNRWLAGGRITINRMYPFDGVHPGDAGYQLFFQAVRNGFVRAVKARQVCRAPAHTVFPNLYRHWQRIRLARRHLPAGWQVARTYRTSMWFDGLSSRWMGDVAMCQAKDHAVIQPLMIHFRGTLVGLLGEADGKSLSFRAWVDGKPVLPPGAQHRKIGDRWSWNTSRFGGGRLFMWQVLSDHLPPGRHTLRLMAILPNGQPKGQLRIESVCAAGN